MTQPPQPPQPPPGEPPSPYGGSPPPPPPSPYTETQPLVYGPVSGAPQPPYGQPPQPPYGSAYGAPPGTPYEAPTQTPGINGFAIASLVFGICGGILLAVIFGIVALVQIKRRGQRGKGLAIAGLSLSGVWLVLIAVGVTVAIITEANRDPAGGIVSGGRVSIDDLRTGDCVNDVQEGKLVASLPGVPCTEPHDGEVVGVFDLPAGTFPGDSEVEKQSEQGCLDRITSYAPSAADDSAVDVLYYSPSRRNWDRGDRKVICLAATSSPRTGSIRP